MISENVLNPKGVAVVIDAGHQCMSTRGVHKTESTTVTSSMKGVFKENQVTRNLNFILKIAVKECLPNWNLDDVTMTTIRHTSFRHHLEDDMTLGTYPKIIAFAKNGLTSPKMLQERYINYISRERTLRDSKKNMRSSDYSLVKRVLVN